MNILHPRQQWFAVLASYNNEAEVREELLRKVAREKFGHLIFDCIFPQNVVYEAQGGIKTKILEPVLPGYLLVNCFLVTKFDSATKEYELVFDTYDFLRGVKGLTGFAGDKYKPAFVYPKEMLPILQKMRSGRNTERKVSIPFEVSQVVDIIDGTFKQQSGVIREINEDTGKISLEVGLFGRYVPLELEPWQIQDRVD